jgi:PRD domain protein (TIGR03582 family)
LQNKRIVDALSEHMKMNADERQSLETILSTVCDYLETHGLRASDDRLMIMASHLLSFVRRVDAMEPLDDRDTSLFEEIGATLVEDSRKLLQDYCRGTNYAVSDTEAFLLAIHFAVCEED